MACFIINSTPKPWSSDSHKHYTLFCKSPLENGKNGYFACLTVTFPEANMNHCQEIYQALVKYSTMFAGLKFGFPSRSMQ